MKKLLTFAAFALFFSFNASAQEGADDGTSDCTQEAWDYGTEMGGGDPAWEYYYTDKYYRENCVD